MRTASLDILRPREETGGADNHAPVSFCWEARSRALPLILALEMSEEKQLSMTGLSHAF